MQPRAVEETRQDLADLERPLQISREDPVELAGRIERILRGCEVSRERLRGVEARDDLADHLKRLGVAPGKVVGDTGNPCVDISTAEILGGDRLAGGGLHERRAGEKNRPLTLHDDDLVRHRRDVGSARRAGTKDGRDLRDSRGRHPGLVVEDPAEVIAVGKDLGLEREERPAGVDEVDTRQPVFQGHLLGAEVLLDGDREVRPPFHGRVVCHDHHLAARDATDAGEKPGARGPAVVHPVSRERRELEERRVAVEEVLDPPANGELSELSLPRGAFRPASLPGRRDPVSQLAGQRLVVLAVLSVVV